MLDNLYIENGKVKSIVNIIEQDQNWVFQNDDPQIHIKFKKPVKKIEIAIKTKKWQNHVFDVKVFYNKQRNGFKKIYTEEKTRTYSFSLNGHFSKLLSFDEPIKDIRLDIANESGSFDIEYVKVLTETFSIDPLHSLNKENEKIVILSHDLTNTGAPILAFNIAKTLKESGVDVAVLIQNTTYELLNRYAEIGIQPIYLEANEINGQSVPSIQYMDTIIQELDQLGFHKIITNTIVSGKYVNCFKEAGWKIVSLIHETKQTIIDSDLLKEGLNISSNSDVVVFPEQSVFEGYHELFNEIKGKVQIRPQGLYLKHCDSLYDELNLDFSIKDRFILAIGTIEKRKGFDYFLDISKKISLKDSDVQFVWIGEFTKDEQMKKELEEKIQQVDLKERLHIVPFIRDAKIFQSILARANVFCLTSRQDPFPSVALEAISYHIPIIGFDKSGGYSQMSKNNRGILIENFDIEEFSNMVLKLLNKEVLLDEREMDAFIQSLSFEQYVRYLLKLFKGEE